VSAIQSFVSKYHGLKYHPIPIPIPNISGFGLPNTILIRYQNQCLSLSFPPQILREINMNCSWYSLFHVC